MNNVNISVKKGIAFNPNSQIIYASNIGLGGDGEEIQLIFVNKRLINEGDNIKLINESNLQVIINKETAKELKELLEDYFD